MAENVFRDSTDYLINDLAVLKKKERGNPSNFERHGCPLASVGVNLCHDTAVGTIFMDDSSEEALKKSAVREVVRAYTAGINHAGRFEFDGRSRQDELRQSFPDPIKDRQFIEQLHADHSQKTRVDVLPTRLASRILLNEGFDRFGITDLDPKGQLREWLAGRHTPAAIRQGLAIFGTEREKGRLKNKTAHRYLVKVIQNCQDEFDLRRQEELLVEYAKIERYFWLQELEAEYERLKAECVGASPEKDLALRLSDNAVFGGLILQRSFWENKLKALLEKQRDRITAVCNHVRRLFEGKWENRFALISKLVAWEYQLAP